MINRKKGFRAVFAEFSESNDLSSFIPEIWANELIAQLLENMVVGQIVNRDFNKDIAAYGDTVHVNKPASFTAKRKDSTDDVTVQNATATQVDVKLDQHFHTSFVIRDEDMTKSSVNLLNEYLKPAAVSIAQAIDKVLLGQHVRFMTPANFNVAGHLALLTSSNGTDYILDTRNVLNVNKVPVEGRVMILNPGTETELLKNTNFLTADKVGDEGTALREASLGRKLGYSLFMCQNMSSFTNPNAGATATATTTAATIAAGATSIPIGNATSSSYAVVGEYCKIGTDATPQLITATSLNTAGDVETITITPGIKTAQAVSQTVTFYDCGAIDGSGFTAGYKKLVKIDGITSSPVVGQQIRIEVGASPTSAISSSGDFYTIIEVNSFADGAAQVYLDRPLANALTNNAIVSFFPSGNYNFAFDPMAITLVNRPMAVPPAGAGAQAAVALYDNIALRIVMQYNGKAQGMLVTVDTLCGVAVLDDDRGAVMLG